MRKLFGKRYRIREFSILWWLEVLLSSAVVIGGAYSWYIVLYLICPNPM